MVKKLFKIVLVVLFSGLFTVQLAHAEGAVIAVVNVAKLLEEAPQAIEANTRLEKEFEPRNKELIEYRKNLREYEDMLSKQGLSMSDSELRKLEREIRDTKREIRRAQEDYREDLNIRRNEELRKLQKRVQDAIVTVATQKKYDLIVGEGVLYSSSRVDITGEVLKVLTEELKSGKTGTGTKP